MQKLWAEKYANLPLHIYEHIFKHLSPSDRIASSQVCKSWEEAIFGSHLLIGDLSVKVVRYNSDAEVQLIDRNIVIKSKRKYQNITIIADVNWKQNDWDNLEEIIKLLDEKCDFKMARIEGTHLSNGAVPQATHLIGLTLPNLKHLELMSPSAYFDFEWPSVFETLPNLTNLILHCNDNSALSAAQRFCRKLTKLTLIKHELPMYLATDLNFPELEELTIATTINGNYPRDYGEVYLPKLQHLNVQINRRAGTPFATLSSHRVVFRTPALKTLNASDVASQFVTILEANSLQFLTMHFEFPRIITTPMPCFFGSLQLEKLERFTVQSGKGWPCMIKLLAFVKRYCPQLKRLVLDEQMKQQCFDVLQEIATTKVSRQIKLIMREEEECATSGPRWRNFMAKLRTSFYW